MEGLVDIVQLIEENGLLPKVIISMINFFMRKNKNKKCEESLFINYMKRKSVVF